MATRKKAPARRRRQAKSTKTPAGTPASNNGAVSDGLLTIELKGGKRDGETLELDVTIVKLIADDLEVKHKLENDGKTIKPTAEFALELSQELNAAGYTVTPTIALAAWVKAAEHFATLQKKTN